MRRAGSASTFVTAGVVEAIFAGVVGDSGLGLRRLGSGDAGGEVADMVWCLMVWN